MGNLARAYILGTKMHYLRLQAHCKQGNPYFSPCGILNQIDRTWEGEITRVLHSFDKTGLHSYLFEERYDLPLVAFHSTAQNVLHRGPSREVLFYLSSSGHREILQADSQPRGHVRGIPIVVGTTHDAVLLDISRIFFKVALSRETFEWHHEITDGLALHANMRVKP